MSKLHENRYCGIDLIKFIMAVFVVCIHTFPWDAYSGNSFVEAFDVLTQTAVPFFFIASGYLLARKFDLPYASELNIKIVFNRMKKMVKMYLMWTAIYFPLAIYSYVKEGYSVPYCIVVTARKIIFRGENFNSWMLWYLLSSIYALLFVLVTMKLKSKPKYYLVSSAVFLIIAKIINCIAWNEIALPSCLGIIKTIISYTITDGRLISGLIYLPLGIYFFFNQKLINNAFYLAAPSFIVLLFVHNMILSTIFSIMLCIGIFSFSLRLNLKDRPVYRTLRLSSTTIYLTHMYVYSIFCFVLYHEIKAGISGFIFSVIVTVAVSVLYTIIKDKRTVKAY
ncbi:MAG: acyltransferase [Clostridia bacterium]|nr:acyltransferase [Clostridia bacterium]